MLKEVGYETKTRRERFVAVSRYQGYRGLHLQCGPIAEGLGDMMRAGGGAVGRFKMPVPDEVDVSWGGAGTRVA